MPAPEAVTGAAWKFAQPSGDTAEGRSGFTGRSGSACGRGGPGRAPVTCSPAALPAAESQCRRLNFVPDALPGGRRFRVLTVADDLDPIVGASLSGLRVGREPDRVTGSTAAARRRR